MKTKHRRELKQNDVAQMVAAARNFLEENGRQLTWAVVAILVVGAAVSGLLAYRNREQAKGT